MNCNDLKAHKRYLLTAALSAATVAALAASTASAAAIPGLHAEFRSINAANIADAVNGVFDPAAFKTAFENGAALSVTQLAPAEGLSLEDTDDLPSTDNWAGLVTGTIDIPTSGRYTLSATLGGAFYLALDGRPVMQSKNSQPCATVVYLEEGAHAIEIGIAKTTGTASLAISALELGAASAAVIPLSWLSYDADAGSSVITPANGDAIYASVGTTVVSAQGGTLASIGINAGASAELYGAANASSLYGAGDLSIGPCIYTKAITSDADTDLDPAKTYTHLVSFPVSGGNATTPTVNGVTFDGSGTVAVNRMNGNFRENKFSDTVSDYRTICTSSQYGCPDFVVILSGLTPGAIYDFRYYWRTRNEHAPRNATFVFYGQDANGSTITNGIATYALEEVFGTGADKCGFIGCRYRAGADGKANLRVISADTSSIYKAAFLYAVSNELLANGSDDDDALELAPAAGERASFYGSLAGAGSATVSGAGEQLLGGAVSLDAPIAVESGRLILADGANVASGVAVASGATVEMRGGAHLGGLSGAGALDLKYGDTRLFGDVGTDGNLGAIPNFRIVHFTNDVSSGVSPSKKYHIAFDYQNNNAPDITAPVVVNEVPFRPTAASGYDMRTVYAYVSGTPVNATSGNEANMRLESTESLYSILSAMRYPNWRTAPNTNNYQIDSLTSGKTYEVRFYGRNWGSSANRTVTFTFTPSSGASSESHTVSLDVEGAASPYYIAIRFTATSSSYTVSVYSPNGDGWSLYGATVELVESGVNDRAFLDVAEDATFAGTVVGGGSVQKNGAGTLTLSGGVDSAGFWYVNHGGLRLANANASVGEVAVSRLAGNAASFGGVGSVDGSVGIPGASTFVLGAPGAGGTLAVGGKVTLGNGATVVVEGANGALGSCSAAEWALPSALSIKPQSRSTASTPLFVCPTGFGNVDTTGWTVYKPNGSVNADATVTLSGDGTTLLLSQTSPFVLSVR